MLNKLTNNELLTLYLTAFKSGKYELLNLSPKQQKAIKQLTNNNIEELMFGGAAGGGKSFLGVSWLFLSCLAYPNTKWFIGRYSKKQILESIVETTVDKVCNTFSISKDLFKVNTQKGFIRFSNGSNINFLELMYKPNEDKEYDRLGSTEYTGGWIEEGGQVPSKAYDILGTRIGRQLNDKYQIKGKLLITCNPAKNWIYRLFWKPYKENNLQDSKSVIQSFITDNQFIEKNYKKRLEKLKGQTRQRLLLGNFDFDDDDNDLTTNSSRQDIFTNYHIEKSNIYYMTADIALSGSDDLSIWIWRGLEVIEITEFSKSDGEEAKQHIDAKKIQYKIPNSRFVFDADGVGAFLGGFFRGARSFHGNGKVINNENYENLKTQCSFKAAEYINDGKIWISCVKDLNKQEKIIEELEQLKQRDKDKDGKLKIIRKDEMKINIGRSPDRLDNIIMRMIFELKPKLNRKVVVI